MSILKTFLQKNKGLALLTFVMICLQIAGTLGVPKLVAKLIDTGIASGEASVIKKIGVEMLLVAFLGTIAAVASSYFSALASARFGFQTREKYFHKFQQLSMKDISRFSSGSLLTRMTNDVDNVQQMIVLFCQMILPAPVICVFTILMMFRYSLLLTWVTLISVVFYVWIVYRLMKRGAPLSLSIQPKMDRITITLREFFTGINMIRAFDNQSYEEKRTNKSFADYANQMIKVNRIFAWVTPIAFLLMGIVYASILWFGGNLVAEGALQIGVVTAVVEYSMLTLAYLMIAAMVLVIIPKSFASLRRIEEILQAEIEIEEETIKTVAEPTFDQTNAAAFEHVTFKYTEISDPVLEDIDFTIPKGKTTAIVGGTGSGKSSLAKLLLRLSDPTIGKVTLGGIPLTQMTQEQIRSHISYVPQKAFLFSGTILSNLQMGNEYASTEELSKAIKIAQLEELVDTLPDGLDSFVAQGGSNYSGGQKQRICIARALIKPAEIYVFDDSFSALDYKTDAALRAALHKHMSEKTLVIVAQRLSTIQQADNIIVLDEGKIVGQGTHEELLSNCQTYQEFAKSQGI
ncbi:ABC transporter ATP-binding protein [Enterococcus faecium]|uniref:ABC transporter ATP-binding protein n=2 Tax=Enterococcus faecium TaxID=1352 RepID=UPI000F6C0308|nr:ABC transporter ATP-binding protein [Enterococcus faecium]VEF86135.1 ABC transporter ATP-binding protein [Enterococcus faecium]